MFDLLKYQGGANKVSIKLSTLYMLSPGVVTFDEAMQCLKQYSGKFNDHDIAFEALILVANRLKTEDTRSKKTIISWINIGYRVRKNHGGVPGLEKLITLARNEFGVQAADLDPSGGLGF